MQLGNRKMEKTKGSRHLAKANKRNQNPNLWIEDGNQIDFETKTNIDARSP